MACVGVFRNDNRPWLRSGLELDVFYQAGSQTLA